MQKEIKPYAFIDREGNKVTIESHLAKQVGNAYGFFNCKASKTEIEAELPMIRDFSQTPSVLELSLTEDIKGDPILTAIARVAKKAGIKYVIEATYPSATNKATADELATILDQTYQSPLYQEGEQFRGEIVYEEHGEFAIRE